MKYLFSSLFVFFIPLVTKAQLVTCNGPDCTSCDLAQTANNVIAFVTALMVLIAVMMLMYAGFKLVTSRGDVSAVQEGKKFVVNVIIGIIIVLAAYVLVDTLLQALTGGSVGIWNPVGCISMTPPSGG